ncbi:hypothetical protein G7046_g3609 [Stylonectria norvegica]|nr:hypothetical protein G7046_g3609 [Stylonectria norvegica]
MLERTAAGLETCSLQRVLPKSAKRCRQLHTGFWQHGASAIDLSTIWSGPPRTLESDPAEADTTLRQLQPALVASFFLLDFLYPTATLPIIRRMYPSLPRTQDGNRKALAPRRRPFSSTAAASNLESAEAVHLTPNETMDGGHVFSKAEETPTPPHDEAATDQDGPSEAIDLEGPVASATLEIQVEPKPSEQPASRAELQRLRKIIEDAHGSSYHEVWDLYGRLDHDQRDNIRGRVVKYLAKSHGIVETGRAVTIFRQIPVEDWDDDLQAAGILLSLRAGDLAYAVDRFKAGLKSKGLVGGLEYILADAITSRQWSSALDAWVAYYGAELKRQPIKAPSLQRLQMLKTLPNQGTLYFAFRSYLATEGAEYYRTTKKSSTSNQAFRVFRRQFAEMALYEPCTPEQAAIILDTLKDNTLYNGYFARMFDRWYEKLESRSTIEKLPEIYQSFRMLHDAKPAVSVLRGMFKVHFPNNMAGLDQIQQDWVKFSGDLNQWGYEKFLKLYASRGDVHNVRRLWGPYVAKYPEVLKSPRGFRSTLNVYSQVGDVTEAEKELRNMTAQYGVEPDLDCWNTVLKGYMRVNDYDRVLSYFDEICEKHEPDSFTFAHVMAMSAKKGDLETTLDFFTRSQEKQIPVTKEMALALVVAYCQNDLLVEAEMLCIELTERKLTHTAIWNQLLNFNGVGGNLNKCYELLERMKDFGVDWDSDTYGFLLQALIQVNEIKAAVSLLKQADEENLFAATPEHYAIVMAGAARLEDFPLVETLHRRLQNSHMPVTFNALVALVDAAVKRKPGVERTRSLGKDFLTHFRESVAAGNSDPAQTTSGTSYTKASPMVTQLNTDSHTVGRAIMLLVQLRDFSSAEELVTLYSELFPQFKKDDQFPPNVVSALMLAHYKDGRFDEVLDLWKKTWQRVLESSKKRKGEGIYIGNAYDLSRVLNVVVRVFRDQDNPQGLSECIDQVTSVGFKLTRSNWSLVVRYLCDMGRWERAMHWCETMLMPGWRGWNPDRSHKEKRSMQNTRLLRAPKRIVFRLQQEWLKLRNMAAWSQDVSRQLRNVEETYPRLYHAFTESSVNDNIPETWQMGDTHAPVKNLDKLLRTMSYNELMKVKEALLKQLMQEKREEKRLGTATPAARTAQDQRKWKRELHNKVRRYAAMWATRREVQFNLKNEEAADRLPTEEQDPEKLERTRHWQDFWVRYDQRRHGDRGKFQPRRWSPPAASSPSNMTSSSNKTMSNSHKTMSSPNKTTSSPNKTTRLKGQKAHIKW